LNAIAILIVSSYLGLRTLSKLEVHQELVKAYKSPNLKISIIPQDVFSKYRWFAWLALIPQVLLEQPLFIMDCMRSQLTQNNILHKNLVSIFYIKWDY
jgi:hypothetical protein